MFIRVMGPVEVAAGEQRARFGGGNQRTILAVLLAAGGHTVSTERLIHALWGDEPPPTARKSLQSYVSRLRSELDALASSTGSDEVPELLVSEPDGYRIDVDGHELDARTFERLVARAPAAADDPEQALGWLDEAFGLVRGPAFGELATHPDVRAEAVRLDRLRAGAAADRIDARLALGRHEQVLGELEAAAAEEPLDERIHGQLMLALYRSGRQADALAAYHDLQQRLREELGVDPSGTLRDLHERILRHDPRIAVPRATSPPSAADRPADTAAVGPASGTTAASLVAPELIGRDEDVRSVVAMLDGAPLVTLTGPGGVGKTRLAEQVAAEVAARFDDVAMCKLAGVREPDAVGDAMITTLGIQPTGEHTAAETLVSALGDRRVLLLLDNCEHVLTPVGSLVDTVLGRCPHVVLLTTSRERLHLPQERVWQVSPLAVPDADSDAEVVAATAAGALFGARAAAAEPSFELTDDNAADVAELCRRLDGMPLAIELAAARVRSLAPADLVARLDRRFSLLAGGPRHEAGRHRTLQAVVAWSYELLDDAEARLFDRLSVFAGSFSLEAAEQVCGGAPLPEVEVAGLLGDLVDRSMVVVERHRGAVRYRLLDTLREFGARRLEETGDPESLRQAHARYHLELVERLGRQVRGPEEPAAVAGIDAAIDDLRAAHDRLVRAGQIDGSLRLPAALGDYAFFRLRDEVTTWARRAVALPGAEGSPAYPSALATAAKGATNRDECTRAHEEAARALELSEPDSPAAAAALWGLATAALYEGRLEEALRYSEQEAELAGRLDEPFAVAFAQVVRVIGHHYLGEQAAAESLLAALDDAAEASGSPTMRAFARYSRGETYLEVRPDDAVADFEGAVELAQEVGNALIEGVSLVSLASLLGRRGRTRQALELFREVVAHWRRLGDHTHQLTTLRNLVELFVQLGADEPAAELHGAVTTGLTPSFGAEAQRLAQAWERLEGRLGVDAAAAAAARGRRLTATQLADEALRHVDRLLAS